VEIPGVDEATALELIEKSLNPHMSLFQSHQGQCAPRNTTHKECIMKPSIYELSAISLQGQDIKMDEFKGKTLLIVNTASKCGLTPQFEGLETLYKKYKDRGLVILGFPSNQFANQEPGDEKSISDGCVLNYGVTFPMFSKVEVNGPNTHPILSISKAIIERSWRSGHLSGISPNSSSVRMDNPLNVFSFDET